ncbi:transmembrane protein, putative (macronuclear) [Tetrahymena thermophila SB210]|uniref:Transmembrane protein, putative n=1 Tax=Tetrahymena thermophila (strain SB210) TaxID=312017 RepID=W7XES9_TETTS|nr:transmembrane protein, putative [Tetrahymena thermophila SB210]EWS72431.1 transmembrane protein, putative [Tetrahymena thermophila SB210]|eukprot:XP_012655033.1 transmembrane protein, putative [Tetrahymena thermophila SB210]
MDISLHIFIKQFTNTNKLIQNFILKHLSFTHSLLKTNKLTNQQQPNQIICLFDCLICLNNQNKTKQDVCTFRENSDQLSQCEQYQTVKNQIALSNIKILSNFKLKNQAYTQVSKWKIKLFNKISLFFLIKLSKLLRMNLQIFVNLSINKLFKKNLYNNQNKYINQQQKINVINLDQNQKNQKQTITKCHELFSLIQLNQNLKLYLCIYVLCIQLLLYLFSKFLFSLFSFFQYEFSIDQNLISISNSTQLLLISKSIDCLYAQNSSLLPLRFYQLLWSLN